MRLNIAVQYTDNNGLPIDITQLEQGTDFTALVTVSNTGVRGEYRELALSQIFPSGWEIRNERMEEGPAAVHSDPYDYQDIRDDRVYTYFSLRSGSSRTYRIRLNAAYTGRFYLSGFNAEAMYDHSIAVRNIGTWVQVVEQSVVK